METFISNVVSVTEPVAVQESRRIRAIGRWVLAAAMAALVATAALVLTFTLFRAQPSGSRSQSTPGSNLDSYLTYLTSQGKMSGTLLVARRGQVILSKGYGLADRAYRVPNGPTVKYPSTLLTPRDLQPDPGVPDARMAYMWKVGHLAGQPVIYRYGPTDLNFTGINMRFPRDGTTIIVNSNVQHDDALPLGVDLAKLLYGRRVIFPLPQGHIAPVPAGRAIQATIDVQTGVALATFVHHAIWLPNDNINTVTRVSAQTDRITGITPLSQALAGSSGDSLSVAGSGSQVWVEIQCGYPTGSPPRCGA